jgi:antitoxin (DNA-binding transcriptional repressor) of toxin-antitoxin stability system
MTYQVDFLEAKETLLELIEKTIAGEEIVITKDNEPVVKLVQTQSPKKRWPSKAGSAKGLVWISDDFDAPLDDFHDYM